MILSGKSRNFSEGKCGASAWARAVVSLAALASFQAAADLNCNGKVGDVLLYSDGTVNIRSDWRGDFTYICSTSGSWAPNITTEVCLAWYATLVKAQASGLRVSVYYGGNPGTCSTLPSYSASPTPIYIGLLPPLP